MEGEKARLFYIDNLRLLMIILVVTHHLSITYSGGGSWYYIEGGHLDALSTLWFIVFKSFNQAYFMGILFMIAGYFVAGGYDRKGFGRFIGDRFKRLMIPTLIYIAAITPFIELVELKNKWTGFSIAGFLSGTGVLWFAAALFIFSLVYGLARLIISRPATVTNEKQLKPSFAQAALLILIIAGCAFLIRIVQPIGTNILNMQLCFFASYIALFTVGIIAYRNNLFARISYKAGKRWLICGIVAGLAVLLVLVIAAVKSGNPSALKGGFTWQSAGYSLWESFVAVAMSIGLVTVFRENFNHQSEFIKAMSDSSFTVYMFHPPIIVAVTLLLKPIALLPIIKWLMLCLICIPLCFAIAYFVLQRVPILNRIL
ncbi:acyltransferase family protein [Desulfosporosinus sp. PR]|uniref:acyltransferase family protein n=1 Tax=Candidatus Desulfosporosinus nitrosoreducens TaxID=3401928 RepID=UPI0027E6BC80|nr:acyltransferase family protein [Desulfosporosinus sp. PR]MDQ7096771.1 acyltransferase family protein [Desulfosporosinus sp. PR]